MKRLYLFLGILLNVYLLFAQESLSYPLDLKPALTGGFAELRPAHFHAGLDFKTQEREGFPVRAVADGHIYRISFSYRSYGIAVYISHANDRQSVYGHLAQLTPYLDSLVLKEQERLRSYEIDIEGLNIPVQAGAVIGVSGNTGASGGPHLHFEWRRQNGTIALNPSRLGLVVEDHIPPTISALRIYPMLRQDRLNVKAQDFDVKLRGSKPHYHVEDTLMVCGRFALGIESLDYADKVHNNLGLYEMRVYQDDSLRFAWRLDEIPFEGTEDIEAFYDYDYFYQHRRRIQWTKVLPNNRLDIYRPKRTDGFFEVNGLSQFRIEAHDVHGNISQIELIVRSYEPCYPSVQSILVDPLRAYMVDTLGVFLSIPAKSLFDEIPPPSISRGGMSNRPRYEIGYPGIPLKKAIYLGFDIPADLMAYSSHILMVYRADSISQRSSYVLGEIRRGRYHIMSKNFGTFAFDIDTVAPQLTAITPMRGRSDEGQSTFRWRVKDDKSGIAKVSAHLDGRWVPLLYDPRDHSIELRVQLSQGRYQVLIEVFDRVGQSTQIRETITI